MNADDRAAKTVQSAALPFAMAGAELIADAAGGFYWPAERLLAVADLHFEKASNFAARGQPLPPYDTAATLATLADLVARHAPRTIVALGDSFHDGDGAARLATRDRAALAALQAGRSFVWIAGNHDPQPALGGEVLDELRIGALIFRHVPTPAPAPGEVAGHLHPAAKLRDGGRSVRRRCFATCGSRIVLPALGALAGGLNVCDAAFAPIFPGKFAALMLGNGRVYPVASDRLVPD